MFKQRVITAIALVLGLLGLLFNLNALNFSLAVAPVVLLAGWEWSNLMGLRTKRHRFAFLALLALSLAVARPSSLVQQRQSLPALPLACSVI